MANHIYIKVVERQGDIGVGVLITKQTGSELTQHFVPFGELDVVKAKNTIIIVDLESLKINANNS